MRFLPPDNVRLTCPPPITAQIGREPQRKSNALDISNLKLRRFRFRIL
jgi:hypothetical protein